MIVLSSLVPSAYADGGFWYIKCTKNVACPLGQVGSITYQISVNGNAFSCNSLPSGISWGSPVSNTCKVVAPVYQSTKTENKSLSCPAAQPSGTWTQSRTYELWSDGSKKNYSSWKDVKKTCAAVKQNTQTENKSVVCAVGEIGSIQQKQTFEVWSDGTKRNYSGWLDVSSTCKAIPTQTTETKDGVQEETCDSYYGATQGTYSGTVYKYGTYTTTYSATAKITDTKFEITSVDFTSCVAQITDITQEADELACPAGQTGSVHRYRIKAQNALGQVSYPYGEDWVVSNNNCASTQIDNQPTVNAGATPNGLLSNISVTSSSLQNSEAFSQYLNSLSASNWATNERHKLTVNIDDMSSGAYSAANVGALIAKFQSVVGTENAEVEISLPMAIDKYLGIGEITPAAVAAKSVILKDVTFDGTSAIVNYYKVSDLQARPPTKKSTVISVIPIGLGLTGITSSR